MGFACVTRLRHMLDAARKAFEYFKGRSRQQIDSDEIRVLAVTRLFEILGEAAKNVSEVTKNRSPEIPWREIAGTRNRLIHGYFNVDLDILWQITTADIPFLIEQLEKLLATDSPSSH
jgi:uncharacterized protein with HEPN domain